MTEHDPRARTNIAEADVRAAIECCNAALVVLDGVAGTHVQHAQSGISEARLHLINAGIELDVALDEA